MPACSTSAVDPLAHRRLSRRRHRRPAAQRGLLSHLDDRGPRARAAVGRVESFPEHAGRRHRRALRLRRAARLRGRGLLVEHDCDRPRRRSDPRGPRRRRRSPAAPMRSSRLTFSGFNLLRLMDHGAVPAVRSQPRRDEHRRRRRRSWCSRISSTRAGAARRSTPSSPATRSACEAFHPTAPEPEGRPVAAVIAARCDDAGTQRRRGRSHQRARHRDAAERCRRSARRSGACSASGSARVPVTSIKSMIGHCLGAAGAVEAAALALTVARGADPADDPPRRDRSRIAPSTSSPTRRGSSASAAASRRRSPLAATIRRW